jgi:glucose/arabinose dehydrogenase
MSGRLLPLVLLVALSGCDGVRHWLVDVFTPGYGTRETTSSIAPGPEGAAGFEPRFTDVDAGRPRIAVRMEVVATEIPQPTDIQFAPGDRAHAYVLGKEGGIYRVSLAGGSVEKLASLEVLSKSEEGLLGLAFHPSFATNHTCYLNRVVRDGDRDVSRVEEWEMGETAAPRLRRVVYEVVQPYPNHDAGQLVFGPDGELYVGWGDGGWHGDPHGNGQNPAAALGKMLRLHVDPRGEAPYAIPPDNPFLHAPGALPETFALGLRNPWRYAFDPAGRLVVADVGQDAWEEIDLVRAGGNYGWNVREGRHCFAPSEGCATKGLTDPIYEYGHDAGRSITGGYVYRGRKIPALAGRYVFGDFVSGRIWALVLPPVGAEDRPATDVAALGLWPILISTFGQDPDGELYVGDFGRKAVYRIVPAGG